MGTVRNLFVGSLLLGLLVCSPVASSAETKTAVHQCPAQKGYVNDFANILPASFVKTLEASLKNFHEQKNIQVVVISTANPAFDYQACLKQWHLGARIEDIGGFGLVIVSDGSFRASATHSLDQNIGPDAFLLDLKNVMDEPLSKKQFPAAVIVGLNTALQLFRENATPPAPVKTATKTVVLGVFH